MSLIVTDADFAKQKYFKRQKSRKIFWEKREKKKNKRLKQKDSNKVHKYKNNKNFDFYGIHEEIASFKEKQEPQWERIYCRCEYCIKYILRKLATSVFKYKKLIFNKIINPEFNDYKTRHKLDVLISHRFIENQPQ
eukprot:501696_1